MTVAPGGAFGDSDDAEESPVPSVRRVRRRRPVPWRQRHRSFLVVSGVLFLVLLGLGAWFGVTAYSARADLQDARAHVQAARVALTKGDSAAAQREVALAAENTSGARSATSALPWDLLAPVPYLGTPLRTTRSIAAAVDDLVVQVLQPTATEGTALSPEKLRVSGSQTDLGALSRARIPLKQVLATSTTVQHRIDAIPGGGWLSSVDDARATLQQQSAELTSLLRNASTAAMLLPPMLGADGPRHYFLAFQTNAEARGTGGLVGAYGILTADKGKLSLDTLGSDVDLNNKGTFGIDLGPDYTKQYETYRATTVWQNSNASAHFPYAAQIWMALWQQQTGQRLDGAIATDPVALSYLLSTEGPVTLPDGESIDASNVVRITESDAYIRFGTDDVARKNYLQSISRAVVNKTINGEGGSTAGLLTALGKAAGEGRLAVWSNNPGEQQVISGLPLGHVVAETAAPYANVVINNAAGNKLEYYLGRTLDYAAGTCTGPTRNSTVTVALTNNAPVGGVGGYVAVRLDRGPTGPPGTSRLLVALDATRGAKLRSVTVDGVATTARLDTELGHPVFAVDVQIPPGATQHVQFQLVEPASSGAPVVPVQPLVLPMGVTVNVPTCGN
jgi:hypothetical protein